MRTTLENATGYDMWRGMVTLKKQLSHQQCGDGGHLTRGSRAESGIDGVGGAGESAQHR